jgi:hypothetical protein
MSGAIVMCSACGKRAIGAKPTCQKCLTPIGRKVRVAPELSDADRAYLAWKAAHGSSVQH